MTDRHDNDGKEPPQIIIQDLRHSRNAEEDAVDEVEQAEVQAPSEPEVPEEILEEDELTTDEGINMEVIETKDEATAEEAVAEPIADDKLPPGEEMNPEMQHLLAIFELGLDNYQKNQLGIYIQFALLHMGRMPHPVTKLVTQDLEKARFAIDLLETSATHLGPDLQPAEKQEVAQVLDSLKMTFTQIASAPPPQVK